MAEIDAATGAPEQEAPKKRSIRGLVIGLAMALALGGGGFFAVYSGLVFAPGETGEEKSAAVKLEPAALPPVAFVPLEPLVISLGRNAGNKHLRFRAELEVFPGTEADVGALAPRVMDVLNSYLRAVELRDLEDPAALIDLRAQMLRRVQLVAGEGRVKDLLIMEFVLN
ncbi:flagellar basal body-associated FliL family protein [Sinisalibacter lacisalsi]|uniref:Flagellar protein FliL n=1 Tax=Sinisalibacter lacisalsi TaxID=1526570 RepID=A0ABQ1QDA1_9RHOB|nr:flagellar basal body-associated FliL family protein [Sinisalibacter lacisalsi]GGD22795.1 flagellar basal body protein FliL [Sinisalibacter lacisalsi]